MGTSFFRGWQLRAAVILTIACAFAALASTAGATTPRQITVSTPGTTSFTGRVFATNMLQPIAGVNPTPCPPGTVDTADATCEHLFITAAASGHVKVCVSFPSGEFGLNDLDLFVVDAATGMTLVAQSPEGS